MFMLNELLIKELSEQVEKNTSDIQDIKDAEVYSTSEVKTNKIWIDGNPIYRKVLTGNIFDGTRNHNISNIKEIILTIGSLWSGNVQEDGTNIFPINTVRVGYPSRALGMFINKTSFAFDKGADIGTSYSFYIIVEYTKTTD